MSTLPTTYRTARTVHLQTVLTAHQALILDKLLRQLEYDDVFKYATDNGECRWMLHAIAHLADALPLDRAGHL